MEENSKTIGLAGAGGCVGGILGFLLRPSVPLIGQLSFDTVLTRGANLSGLDSIFRPIAEQSFNQLLACIVVGVILGGFIGIAVKKKD